MIAGIGSASTALVPVKIRTPAFATLNSDNAGSLELSKISAEGDDTGSRFATHPAPGVLRRMSSNDNGNSSRSEIFAGGTLTFGTAQLLTLQSEDSASEDSALGALAERDYNTVAALGRPALGRLVIAA